MRAFSTLTLLFALFFAACNPPGGDGKRVLRLAVSANFSATAEVLAQKYQAKSGVELMISVASSSKLCTQIEHGADFDVFLSADTSYPNHLFRLQHATAPAQIYCRGSLIAWSTTLDSLPQSIAALKTPGINKIAIANPETAPYGRAAVEALEKAGLWEAVRERIVYGESISQVNLYIENGSVDIGLTALSARKSDSRGVMTSIESELYSPIAQGMVITRSGAAKNAEVAGDFVAFMGSDEAKAVMRAAGYAVD